MLEVGVTGGIGSGKSTVCRLLSAWSVPVFVADDAAKALMAYTSPLRPGIEALFGTEAYTPDHALNRAHIAASAFTQPGLLEALNALVHPAVQEAYAAWKPTPDGYLLNI